MWCSALALKSARECTQASSRPSNLPCIFAVQLCSDSGYAYELYFSCGVSLTPLLKESFTQSFLAVHLLIEVAWATETLKAATVQLGFTNLCVQTPLMR